MSKKQQIEKLESQVKVLEEKVNEMIGETQDKFNLIGYGFPVSKILPPSEFGYPPEFTGMILSGYEEIIDKQPVSMKRFRALEEYLKVRFISERKKDFYEKSKKK